MIWYKQFSNLSNASTDSSATKPAKTVRVSLKTRAANAAKKGASEKSPDSQASIVQALQGCRLWHVLPAGETDLAKASGLFDAETGLCYPPASALEKFLAQHPFAHVRAHGKKNNLATLHSATRLLWNHESSNNYFSLADGQKIVAEGRWAGLERWALPSKDELYAFATANGNPHRQGQAYRLRDMSGDEDYLWLTAAGVCDVDNGCWGVSSSRNGSIFARHALWQSASPAQMLADLAQRGWQLQPPSGEAFVIAVDDAWKGLSIEALQARWKEERLHLVADNQDESTRAASPEPASASNELALLDYTPCRLPQLSASQLTDPKKGLWELWGATREQLDRLGYVARDPALDLRPQAVAIDFGTSSTVVAVDTPAGIHELLRIGVRDFYEKPAPRHFQNPTVLECLDYPAFAAAWTAHPYRPALDWDWMRAAHEAQANYRDNPGQPQVLASILPRLKQWALRASKDRRVHLTDRQGHEIELPMHTARTLVRGQALQADPDHPFDPIELYAWYLGMAINWRGRGLYLRYYLSFPVKYPREVRERIVASFAQGLQRSLPPSLIAHHPEVLNRFEVTALASEPAAYAAAALNHLRIEPTEAGVPYAVFDFGGGTTDFDFGLLRWATPEEEDQGHDQVLEQLATSGDEHLGGEGLLEHLVYATFQHNLEVLRQQRIQFTCPLDAAPFAGSESFLAPTQAAQTNTVMLAARLRPFMEGEDGKLEPQIKLELLDAEGQHKHCELHLDAQALDALLAARIGGGVRAFLAELARLRPQLPEAAPIHVLLAGNASLSRHVRALFDTQGSLWTQLLHEAFGEQPPDIVVHLPLPLDEAQPYAPTAKTGVALGLLRLAPGESTLLVNHVQQRHDGQAPFAWFVGRLRRGSFEPVLAPGATYGQWQELGPLQHGVFNLWATTSVRARAGLSEHSGELRKTPLHLPAAQPGERLYARPSSPHVLELACASSPGELAQASVSVLALS
ncbi:hypothetical protein GCM10027019_13090 [Melaminivora jejuensis]